LCLLSQLQKIQTYTHSLNPGTPTPRLIFCLFFSCFLFIFSHFWRLLWLYNQDFPLSFKFSAEYISSLILCSFTRSFHSWLEYNVFLILSEDIIRFLKVILFS
jgi:hypothetical protein